LPCAVLGSGFEGGTSINPRYTGASFKINTERLLFSWRDIYIFARVVDNAKRIVVTHVCVSVCLSSVCLSLAAFSHYFTDPDVTWGNGRGCPLVVYHCADLQSVHVFRCYKNMNVGPNAKCRRVLVLALWLVFSGVGFVLGPLM